MLQYLYIKNYAIIDELELTLEEGFHVITGETGAGKSIIVGALNLLTGQRADRKLLLHTDKKCIVEASFVRYPESIQQTLIQQGLQWDNDELLLRREILPTGSSRAYVNDHPVPLQTLKALSAPLIEIHRQHHALHIFQAAHQMHYIDFVAGATELYDQYKQLYAEYRSLQRRVEQLLQQRDEHRRLIELLDFQCREIENLNIDPDEDETLEEKLRLAERTQSIQRDFRQIVYEGYESEHALIHSLRQHIQTFSQYASLKKEWSEFLQRWESLLFEMEDIYQTLADWADDIDYDPHQLEQWRQRYDQLQKLLLKHQAPSIADLLQTYHRLQQQLDALHREDHDYQEAQTRLQQLRDQLHALAQSLSEKRRAALPDAGHLLNELLHQLGMPHARIEFAWHALEDLGPYGYEHIEMLFTANPGLPPRPLKEVSSGGELSRINLAIKATMASASPHTTLLLDEIDTGISGAVAQKMGQLLQQIARRHQVILITHSPLIASFAQHHWLVQKHSSDTHTYTSLQKLNAEQRIRELAVMLGGQRQMSVAVENARQLLQQNARIALNE